ncbi:MAG: hypothetical protein HC795_15585 [Coleofasciculaceae cyanobacterium RL_1_1]|nr:hypothetical protein [Coleofasciculaceae cyanobacterium RL_1_1]
MVANLERLGQQLHAFGQILSPYLGIICVAVAWLTVFAAIGNAIVGLTEAAHRMRTMHQIPCSRCAFFTNDHRLKCSVDPIVAGSEAAINCPHYEPSRDTYQSRNSENII